MLALAVAFAVMKGTAQSRVKPLAIPVRYENAGANAKTVLADIAKLTNVPLATASETAGEILSVRFQGESLAVVMKRLAWAVDGSWKPLETGFELFRPVEQLHAEERREADLRVAAYRAGIEKIRKDVKDTPELTADEAGKIAHSLAQQAAASPDGTTSLPPIKGRRPIGRAIARLMLLLDPGELADIPAECKVAYSTQPTHAQRPFSAEELQVMQEFSREQTLWLDAASTMKIPTVAANPNSFDAPNIGCAFLTAAKFGAEDDFVQLLLRIADRNGRFLARASLPMIPAPIADSNSPRLRNASDPPIAVPPEVVEILQAADEKNRTVLSASTRTRACSPEKVDPLSLTTGRLLLLAAVSRHQSLVADLADGMLLPPTNGKQFRAGEFIDGVTAMTAERNATAEWIGIRPLLAARARANRDDRAALGRLLRRCALPRPLSIDELAAFAIDLPPASSNEMPSIMRRLVTTTTPVESFDDRTLRFYGFVDETSRSVAQQRGIRMDTLSPDAANMLAAILTEPETDLDITPQRRAESGRRAFVPVSAIMLEPTQGLPDGIPGAGLVRIEVSQESVAGIKPTIVGDNSFDAQALTPQEVAWYRYMKDHPGAGGPVGMPQPPVARLMFGSRTRYVITFQFTPEISINRALESANFGDEREVAFDELPEDFRKAVDAAYAQLTEQFKNVKRGDGQPGNPPTGGVPPPK